MELPPLLANLTRPLVAFDTETTGTDPVHDRIIDLAVVRMTPGEAPQSWVWRFNPGIPIPPEATAVHGISDADVADCPSLLTRILEVRSVFADCDFTGFNILQFDLPLLKNEFARCQAAWCAEDARVLDSMKLFHKLVPKNLSTAVQFYLGRDHEGAHGALADTQASVEVLASQLHRHPELAPMDFATLATFCQEVMINGESAQVLDADGKLCRTKDGIARFTFGKHQGLPVLQQRSYAMWMLGQNFSESTKAALRTLMSAPVVAPMAAPTVPPFKSPYQ